jgi:hypothetical protein
MFNHSFNGYMRHAFPFDELDPVNCKPFVPPDNTDNGILGNYSLTLIDNLDTIAVRVDNVDDGV